MNIAARLEGFDKDGFSSDPGESSWRILVGEETVRRVRGAFRAVDLGAHALKGKAEAIGIHRILGGAGREQSEGLPDRER